MKIIGFDDPKAPTIVFDCRNLAAGTELSLKNDGENSLLNYVLQVPYLLLLNKGDMISFKTAVENFKNNNCPRLVNYFKTIVLSLSNAEEKTVENIRLMQMYKEILSSMGKQVETICAKPNQDSITVAEKLWKGSAQLIEIKKIDVPFKVGEKARKVVSIEDCGIVAMDYAREHDLINPKKTNSRAARRQEEMIQM